MAGKIVPEIAVGIAVLAMVLVLMGRMDEYREKIPVQLGKDRKILFQHWIHSGRNWIQDDWKKKKLN